MDMNRVSRAMGLLICTLPLFGASAFAAQPHHHTVHKGVVSSSGPVVLSQQPGTALDKAARDLNKDDITHAQNKGDQPIVLIGSAPLAVRGGDAALFVQLQSANLCGSAGCSTSVFVRKGTDWQKVLDSVSGPVVVSRKAHGGMYDLLVGDHDRWVWRGDSYHDTLPGASIGNLRQSVEEHQAKMRASQSQTPSGQ